MFDVVTSHQHKAAVIIDRGGVHHRKTGFAIATSGNICSGGKMADGAPNDVENNQCEECCDSGHDRDGIIRPDKALNPFPHLKFPSITRTKPGGTLSRLPCRLQGEMPFAGMHVICLPMQSR